MLMNHAYLHRPDHKAYGRRDLRGVGRGRHRYVGGVLLTECAVGDFFLCFTLFLFFCPERIVCDIFNAKAPLSKEKKKKKKKEKKNLLSFQFPGSQKP